MEWERSNAGQSGWRRGGDVVVGLADSPFRESSQGLKLGEWVGRLISISTPKDPPICQ